MMKKNILLVLCLSLVFFVSDAQIINPSFETWTATTEYEQPVDMKTSNSNNFVAGEAPNVTKVTGLDGFAVRATGVKILGFLNFPGVVGTEDLLTDGIETVAYTGTPDGVEAIVRHNVQPGDTAKIVFVFYNQGAVINSGVIELTGIVDNFTQVSIDFPDFTMPPDQIYWSILSSGLTVANVDSWVEVDHINFTGGAPQLANNSFNDWEERGWEDPDDWYSTNKFTQTLFKIDGVTKTSDAQDGEWALQMESSVDDEISTVNIEGIFLTDFPDLYNDQSSREYSIATQGNNTLRGYYKYIPNGNLDHAAIGVVHNDPDATTDASVVELFPTTDWTSFELIFPSGADSILIQAAPGLNDQLESFTNVGGSKLYLDNLSLDITVATQDLRAINVKINYLSTSNIAQISTDGSYRSVRYQVLDLQGRLLMSADITNQNQKVISLNQLTNGMYIIQVITDKGQGSKKIMVTH